MTWNEFRKMILQKGWVLDRHGSRHDIYKKKGGKHPILVERHWREEIKPNLQKALLKQIEEE
ncbi:MAG: type II toxin-antitoxin system HicA family toxin [Bacteroidales bacterium]|nr:type II toxin-antitoxin system HicA family toxin [Bacteroidales bacterium]